ncbi:MAG: glycogen debranching enzyme N-terminal domain-containing protein [Clostridia bacterium]|nr:glycogen debranching enzyme N-terminal domain-containing protein [Clostridia bacterium]
MKINKKQVELKECLGREWIITNGIGGFASSSILGANTRRYHGLLIAPLMVPAQRHLIISKLDESIVVNEEEHKLFTNVCENFISDGYKYLESFEKEYLPVFTYKVNDIKITKTISMVYGENTVVVQYKIKNGKNESKLKLAPIVNFRDFHSMNTNHQYSLNQKVISNKVKLEVDNSNFPFYIFVNDGKYIEHENDTFWNMFYLKEEERGFYPEENLLVPGRFEIMIKPKETKEITFIASLDENIENIDGNSIIENEIKRLKKIVESTDLQINKSKLTKQEKEYNDFIKDLVISSDSFVINRPDFGTHSIIAGYPWFLDWGRDTLIAYEGLLLLTKRFDLAKEILLTFTRDIKCGLVPNGYSEADNQPLYNSADASLLLFEQVNKFLQYTKDYDFIKENIYESLKDIIENYSQGIDLENNNIYIAEDMLLCSGTETTQNTWMDAKIGNFAVTPRNGKVVELNALWYNALRTLENLANKFEEKDVENRCRKAANKHQKVFEEQFFNKKKKSLDDVIGDSKIRPNQLFSISCTYPVIKPSSEIGKTIFKTVTSKLLTKYGLRTLAKGEEGYIPYYEGDPVKRDMSYHQGIVWVWLIGLYHDSLKNIIDDEKDRLEKEKLKIEYEKFIKSVYSTFKTEIISEEGIGSISEVYSSQAPFKPGGTFAQAWSVSEVLKIVTKYDK